MVALHRDALLSTGRVVRNITTAQLQLPMPDKDWDVRDLLTHVVAGNLWAAALAAGCTIEEVGDRFDGDVLGADPLGAYDRSSDAAAAAFERPGALDASCAVSYGPVPGSIYAGHRFIDVLIHGWDLAVATQQDTHLEPELIAAAIEVIEPQLEMLQESGAFGQPVKIHDGTDPQTRLLAMLGRQATP